MEGGPLLSVSQHTVLHALFGFAVISVETLLSMTAAAGEPAHVSRFFLCHDPSPVVTLFTLPGGDLDR